MTHGEAYPLLLELAYGELHEPMASEVRRHAETCAECTAELDAIGGARAFASRRADLAPAPGRQELVEAARRAVLEGRRRPARRRITASLAAAAVIAVVAGVTVRIIGDRSRRAVEEVEAPAGDVVVEPPSKPVPSAVPPPRPAQPQRPPGEPQDRFAPRRERHAGPTARPDGHEAPSAPAPAPEAKRAATEREAAAGSSLRADESGARAARPLASATGRPPVDARQVMEHVERRAAAGELSTERGRLACAGVDVERIALVAPGGHVVRLTVREGDRPLVEGWYDDGGRLRAVRTHDPGGAPAVRTVDGPSGPALPRELPSRAPAPEELGARCEW